MVKLLESGEGLTGEDEDVEDGQEGGKKRKGGTKKPLPSTYEPDARSQGWLKVKKGKLLCSLRNTKADHVARRLPRGNGRLARLGSDRRMVGSWQKGRLVQSDLVRSLQSGNRRTGGGV